MNFSYSAKSMKGELLDGVLDAETIAAARQLLRERGLFALSLSPLGQSRTTAVRPQGSFWKARVSRREIALLTSQLVIMCKAGVELAEALQNVAVDCRNPTLKAALDEAYQDVANGQSFSTAMKKQTHLFGESYVASLAAGEASGNVSDVLSRMVGVLNSEIKLQSAVKSALSYPLVLMFVCLFVVGALLLFVLPQFGKVFENMGNKPPATTQFLLDLAQELRNRLWLWIPLPVGTLILCYKLIWAGRFRRQLDNLAFRMALIGDVLKSLVSGRLFMMLGTMLQNGVPLIQALQLCRSAMRSVCYQDLVDSMQTEVLNGRLIGPVLNRAAIVPSGAAQMVGIAEKTGKLGDVMQLVGEYYESEGQRKIQELAKLLEPAIIIVMGVVVAFVVASIMLPMLDISATAGQ